MRTPTALLAALAALAGLGCQSVPPEAIEDCDATHVVPLAVSTDILFVIDDSVSMGEEQTLLQNGLGRFINTLVSSPVLNDFQVGVTTTSVAQFDGTASLPAGGLVSPGVMRGYTTFPTTPNPTLVSDFQAAVVVGTGGSSREQPFEAMRLALEKSAPGGTNAGFLRPGARLAIIFLSDEDDCSGPTDAGITTSAGCRSEKVDPASTLVPVADVAALLRGPIGGEARDVVVAAVVGVAPSTAANPLVLSCGLPHCSDQSCGTATDKGDRFLGLLAGIGAASTRLASICDASFDQALDDFAGAILSQTLPLDGAPADWRMLVATVDKPAMTVGCVIAPSDAAPGERAAADAIYEPPQAGRPASLTFQNACALEQGDRVNVRVICAG